MFYHVGGSWHTENIQINNVIGEKEECVVYVMEKIYMNFMANPSMLWLT